MKHSRADYLAKKATHREYYGQFVTNATLSNVESFIGLDKILNSTDKHLNDIPLRRWDRLHPINHHAKSLSDNVCIAKEAARQIIEREGG